MTHRPSVLITDSNLRTALYTIRSLGRSGYRVIAMSPSSAREDDLGGCSRYLAERIVCPSVVTDPEAFTEVLIREARRADVIFPIGMHSIRVVAAHLPEFASAKTLLPDLKTIDRADYAQQLLPFAASIGIPQPLQYNFEDLTGARAGAEVVRYPVIVKAGIEGAIAPSARYRIVDNMSDFVSAFETIAQISPRPIVQEIVSGRVYGYEALYQGGRMVRQFCHRRLRQYPLKGGPSTYCESVRHPEVIRLGRTLLDALAWDGLAMVEFMVDESTGAINLMEINPRPWGSMALPIVAGIDFPVLWVRAAMGEFLEQVEEFPAGVRMRLLMNDLQAVASLVPGESSWANRFALLASVCDPRVHDGILSWSDPVPSWQYVVKALRRVGRS